MVVKRRRKNPIKIMIITTAVLLIMAVATLFIWGYGDFSINHVFDVLLNGEKVDEFANNTSVSVNVAPMNEAYGFRITDELESRIIAYFTLHYAALGELDGEKTKKGLNKLYGTNAEAKEYDNTILEYQTEKRKNSGVKLTYSSCDVSLIYIDSNVIDETLAEIVIHESFSVVFDGFPGIKSATAYNEHFFTFYYTKEYGWQIERHEDRSRFGKYVRSVFLDILGGENPNGLKNVLNSKLSDYKDPSEYVGGEIEAVYPYDRDAAVKYALDNIDLTHGGKVKQKYPVYTDNGMNFISQCINAGDIPMDAQGEGYLQWKWYSDELNHEQQSEKRTGFSASWVDGNDFFWYISNNTGFGMISEETPLVNAERGDIIQFVDKSGEYALYQCIVTGKSEGELLLTANSDNILNMPISALGFDEIRAIKIYGYNSY